MISFQQLIQEAEEETGPESDRSMDLRIEISVHGKSSHLWKAALALARRTQVGLGSTVTFMLLDGEKLVDDLSDDLGENWHAHDPDNPVFTDEGLHGDKSREGHPAKSRSLLAP